MDMQWSRIEDAFADIDVAGSWLMIHGMWRHIPYKDAIYESIKVIEKIGYWEVQIGHKNFLATRREWGTAGLAEADCHGQHPSCPSKDHQCPHPILRVGSSDEVVK